MLVSPDADPLNRTLSHDTTRSPIPTMDFPSRQLYLNFLDSKQFQPEKD